MKGRPRKLVWMLASFPTVAERRIHLNLVESGLRFLNSPYRDQTILNSEMVKLTSTLSQDA